MRSCPLVETESLVLYPPIDYLILHVEGENPSTVDRHGYAVEDDQEDSDDRRP
jgi:hypothetical protein